MADERDSLLGILHADPTLLANRRRQVLIADKNYYGRGFETDLVDARWNCCAPPAKASRPDQEPGS